MRPTLFDYEVAWSARTEQFVLTTTAPQVTPLERTHKVRVAITIPGSSSPDVNAEAKPKPRLSAGQAEKSLTSTLKPVCLPGRGVQEKAIIHFSFGSAAVRPSEQSRIHNIASSIKEHHGGKVSVTGYTCWIGPMKVNEKLALARAMAVVHELGKEGVKVSSVSARPKCCYIDLKHAAPNRRAEISWERR